MRILPCSGRVRRGTLMVLTVAFVLGAALPAFAASPPSVRFPASVAPRVALSLDQSALSSVDSLSAPLLGDPALRSAFPQVAVDAPAATVNLPLSGIYYWLDTYLCVDGYVTNNTASAAGPIAIQVTVKDAGVTVKTETTFAFIYNLVPGRDAAVKMVFDDLVSYAGRTDLVVEVANLADQPSQFPEAIDLTLVDKTMTTDADGVRTWTCTFRNDATVPVEAPLAGGWEWDSSDARIDTLYGADATAKIAPGATVSIEVYGTFVGVTPARTEVYAQAMPSQPDISMPVYRFFNVRNANHFYTDSASERDMVIATWPDVFRYEGIAYYVNPAKNEQPLYRFFYRRGSSHFYTASVQEASMILAKWPDVFTYDGTTYRVSREQVTGGTTVYRFLNRRNSSHFYTASAEERDMVTKRWPNIFIYEGPAFWVVP